MHKDNVNIMEQNAETRVIYLFVLNDNFIIIIIIIIIMKKSILTM